MGKQDNNKMKLTIKLNTGNIEVNQISDGVEIVFDGEETQRDLWKASVNMWLEDSESNLKDFAAFYISHKDKMNNFTKK